MSRKDETSTIQTFLIKRHPADFCTQITKAFLAADIPLYKGNNPTLKRLFRDIGHSLPSETCRKKVEELGNDELDNVKKRMYDKEIFIGCDESDISGKQYLSILVGTVDKPEITYLLECKNSAQPQTLN